MTEYILIIALVVILAIAAFKVFGPKIINAFSETGSAVEKQGQKANNASSSSP